jgi:hypothetical protein
MMPASTVRSSRRRARIVLVLRFTTAQGATLTRTYDERTIAGAPAWLHLGPPDWLEPGSDSHEQATPSSPHVLTGRILEGRERDARRALGLGRR